MRSVNARRFREARHLCVLSQQATADLLRVSLRTIKNWESGNVRVPYAAYKLMRILRGYQLPGESWRGWNLKGDVMWSPEGRAFRASDHGWWSLIVAKADAFDRWVEQRRCIDENRRRCAPSSLVGPSRPVVACGHAADERVSLESAQRGQSDGTMPSERRPRGDFSTVAPSNGPTSNTGQKCSPSMLGGAP